MSAPIRAILEDTVTRIVALAPRTHYTRPRAMFEHNPALYDPSDLRDVQSPTRMFTLHDSGGRQNVGSVGQVTQYTEIQATLTLTVAYAQGRDVWELERVIAEDLDDIRGQLERVDGYPSAPGLSARDCSGAMIQRAKEAGGVTLVTIPITVRYTAQLAG